MVYLPRGLDQAVACLAVVRAGGHYLALDPAHPTDRIWAALIECDAGLMLATSVELADIAGIDAIRLDTLDAVSESEPHGDRPSAQPDRVAVVLRGERRAVAITDREIGRCGDRSSDGPARVWLHAAAVTSPTAVAELWGTLLAGARGVIAAPGPSRPTTSGPPCTSTA